MSAHKQAWQFGTVFFCTLVSFLLVPLSTTKTGFFCLNFFFVVILCAALWISQPGRKGLCIGGGLLLWRLIMALLMLHPGSEEFYVKGQYLLVVIVGNAYVGGMLLFYVFLRRGSHGSVIIAALTSYVLMGFILTNLCLFIELVHPGSFWVQAPGATAFTWSDAAAYSFHLLSPMGPPGVVAVGVCARSVAIVGAFLGFCYTAILVAKVVTWAPILKPKE